MTERDFRLHQMESSRYVTLRDWAYLRSSGLPATTNQRCRYL